MRKRLLLASLSFLISSGTFAQTTGKPATGSTQQQIAEAVFQSQVEFTKMLLDPAMTAEEFYHCGDYFKSRGQLPEAANAYLIALRIDPKLNRAEYQLACTFVYWGKDDLAIDALQRAADKGFWGWRLMTDDSDLQPIRGNTKFKTIAQQVKTAYDAEAPKHAGQFTVKVPNTPVPAAGHPVILLMHGMGSHREDFEPICSVAAELGLVGVTLDGSIVSGEEAYIWDDKSIDVTHQYLQDALAKIEKQTKIDRSRIYLGGFSQGANRSAALLMTHSKDYRGAVVNSPGGEAIVPKEIAADVKPPPVYFFVGSDESPIVKSTVNNLEQQWKLANVPSKHVDFDGTHQFPPDAEAQYRNAIQWLLDQSR